MYVKIYLNVLLSGQNYFGRPGFMGFIKHIFARLKMHFDRIGCPYF